MCKKEQREVRAFFFIKPCILSPNCTFMALVEKLLIFVKRVEGVKIHEESTVMSYLIENQFSICRTFFPIECQ